MEQRAEKNAQLSTDPTTLMREQAERICRSGALGRSRSYAKFLQFLVECSIEDRAPKELEIAMEVFGRGADFDPSQDSMVRVYAHNLRQKLEHYYATEQPKERYRLSVVRGEYRLTVTDQAANDDTESVEAAPPAAATQPVPAPRDRRWWLGSAAASLIGVAALIGWAFAPSAGPAPARFAPLIQSPFWSSLFDDELPILVVVGDYYIFGEIDSDGEVQRLVRDFSINSSRDLDERLRYEPDLQLRYMDLELTYLPRGTAFALLDVLRVLYASDKPVRVVSMSELSIASLKSNHVVYIGYVSGLGALEEFVFASSSLAVGETYDELKSKTTGELYTSEGGLPARYRHYSDYSLVSTFPGPGGNQFVIAAGTRDAGLMQAGHAVSDPVLLGSFEQQRPGEQAVGAPAFEMLYEVMGYSHTNLDATLVHSAPLDYQKIWGGKPLSSN